MNAAETALMNNPVRAALQRHYEAPLLERLGGRTPGARVLEVGCGRGIGTEIILDRFGATHVTAVDLDPAMVSRAQRRLSPRRPRQVSLAVGDAAAIHAADAAFDAVFDFGIIHHVPDWRSAVAEVARVLRPGGRFFFEEVTRHALTRWSYRTFLDHPRHDRFSATEFVDAIVDAGFDTTDGRWVERFLGDFVIGVAIRQGAAG
jgi:ubiquinone/menaquinone biosynthesis C-methylase UbiE